MANSIVITVSESNNSITVLGINNDTITLGPGTTTVTITQGASVTLANTLSLPSTFSAPITVTPTTATLANQEYVFTCMNNLTTSASAVTTSCLVTVSFVPSGQATSTTTTFFPDPTMIFNPPQQNGESTGVPERRITPGRGAPAGGDL